MGIEGDCNFRDCYPQPTSPKYDGNNYSALRSFALWEEYTFDSLTNGNTPADGGTDGFQTVVTADAGVTDGVVDNTRSVSGANSCKFTIASGGTSWGSNETYSIGQAGAGDDTLVEGQEFWVQFEVFHPTGYDNDTTGDGGTKFFRNRFRNVSEVPVGSITWQLRGGTTITGLRTEMEGQGLDDVDITLAGNGGFALNQWNKFEFYTKVSDSGAGVIRAWCNNFPAGEVTGLNIVPDLTLVEVMTFNFFNFWNNGSPQEQSVWVDNVKKARSTVAIPTNTDSNGNLFIGGA